MFECAECFIYFIVYDFIESYFLKQLTRGNTGSKRDNVGGNGKCFIL